MGGDKPRFGANTEVKISKIVTLEELSETSRNSSRLREALLPLVLMLLLLWLWLLLLLLLQLSAMKEMMHLVAMENPNVAITNMLIPTAEADIPNAAAGVIGMLPFEQNPFTGVSFADADMAIEDADPEAFETGRGRRNDHTWGIEDGDSIHLDLDAAIAMAPEHDGIVGVGVSAVMLGTSLFLEDDSDVVVGAGLESDASAAAFGEHEVLIAQPCALKGRHHQQVAPRLGQHHHRWH
jgi:hypothetical protein